MISTRSLQAAWSTALDHSDWAEEVRAHVRRHGLEQPESFLALVQACPALPEAWQQLGPPPFAPELLDHVLQLLTPAPEFGVAWQTHEAETKNVFIPLSCIDKNLWRGPQPTRGSLSQMRGDGLRAVINLRAECGDSETFARETGLPYFSIPVQDMSVPRPEQIIEFLQYFINQQPVPALVHCFAGQGRTGLFVACYRIWRGMEVEHALEATDLESQRRGMRPSQREWVRQHMGPIREHLCSLSK